MLDNRKCELLANRPPSERAAQKALQQMGYTVIAQYPIRTARSTFYADLYIPELRLVIEIDGDYHFTRKQRTADALRSQAIRRRGLHVYRLKAADAYHTKKIRAKLAYFKHRNS